MEQTDFVGELQYEKGYGAGFTAGQRENMKAINTIISSGDNIQSALKKFADDLQQKNDEAKEKPANLETKIPEQPKK